MTLAIAQVEVRDEAARLDVRRYLVATSVLAANLVLALLPAVIGCLVLFGVVR